jgi:hypothetical protein
MLSEGVSDSRLSDIAGLEIYRHSFFSLWDDDIDAKTRTLTQRLSFVLFASPLLSHGLSTLPILNNLYN